MSPDGAFIVSVNPRATTGVPEGEGNTVHILQVDPTDGTVTELTSSTVELPLALGTNPIGMALVGSESAGG
jgi:hypothetical protein